MKPRFPVHRRIVGDFATLGAHKRIAGLLVVKRLVMDRKAPERSAPRFGTGLAPGLFYGSSRAYITPPYGLRANGPLMTGGCEGAASGAGMRFSKVGLVGGDAPKRVVGLRMKLPPTPCPTPPLGSK
jgi:hypothetical protein